MPLWTNGSAYVVATGWGVARCEDAKKDIARFSPEGLKRDQDPPGVEVFAILDAAEGSRALIRRRGEPSMLWSAGGGFDPLEGPELLAAVPIGKDAILACIPDGDRLVLRRAKIDKGKIAAGDAVSLPAGEKVRWSSALWKKGEETWPESDDDRDENEAAFDPSALSVRSKVTNHWPGRVTLVANRCGIAVTSTYSGQVALLDPKSLEPVLAARVPTEEDQFGLFALPIPQGVLLTLVADGRQTEYVVIDRDREVLAHRHKLGKDLASGAFSAGLLWSDEKVVVNQHLTSSATHFLALPGLAPKQFSKDDAVVVDCASAPDGSKHLVALAPAGDPKPQSWKLLRYDPNAKKLKGESLDMPDFKPPPPPIAKPEKRKRAEGSPVLAMKPDTATPWRANVSEMTALRLQVMNRGGPLSGMYVELAGNAVSDGVVAAEEATLGGAKGRFEKRGSAFRVEISEAKLDAHFADASRADPAPWIELIVKIRAERAGNALMTVRVGPIGATGITGSAMEGRSFVVSA